MAARKAFFWFAFLAWLLSACTTPVVAVVPSATPTVTPPVISGTPTAGSSQAAAIQAAQNALAATLGVQSSAIQLANVTAVNWPDACLSVPDPSKTCAGVATPGYRIILSVNGDHYEVHTNRDGSSVELLPAAGSDLPAVQSAVRNLLQKLRLNSNQIRVISVKPLQWPNGCLGVQPPGVKCNQLVTPGYQIILEALGSSYEYHTDQTGAQVVQVAMPASNIGVPLLTWQSQTAPCQTAQIGVAGLSFGLCSGQLTSVSFINPNRIDELNHFLQTYPSFPLVQTTAGDINFYGQGQQVATADVQRSIAEWARMVVNESEGQHSAQSSGLVLTWHREGGIAGLCNNLDIYTSGIAYATSCRGGQTGSLGTAYLTPDQLKQLYGWQGSYRRFEIDRNAPGTADAINISLVFIGNGAKTAGDVVDQALLLQFANDVFNQAVNP